MPSSREQEQINRAVNVLRDADRLVWSNFLFPRAHRPDVDSLAENIKIADQPSQYIYHPNIRPDILRDVARRNQRLRERISSTFWYDSVTRELVISRRAFNYDDGKFRRFCFNHAARDNVARREVIEPDQYPDDLVQQIEDLLKVAFHIKNRPPLQDTKVIKAGFMRTLFAGSHIVTDLVDMDTRFINEVYPASLEIITDKIMIEGGNIFSFDSEVQKGLVGPTGKSMEHFRFANTLVAMMQVIDWRDILTAFGTGDVAQTIAILEQKAKQPNIGGRIYGGLVEAMRQDETSLMGINAVLNGGPKFHFNLN